MREVYAAPKPAARWRHALVCNGCGADAGEVWAPSSCRRTSRESIGRQIFREADEHATCDRCRGVDRAARKARRRAELAPRPRVRPLAARQLVQLSLLADRPAQLRFAA